MLFVAWFALILLRLTGGGRVSKCSVIRHWPVARPPVLHRQSIVISSRICHRQCVIILTALPSLLSYGSSPRLEDLQIFLLGGGA